MNALRILRSEFTRYSDFQARRLVRTEATNAANLGVEKGATTLFPPDQLNKRWLTARDGRVRSFFNGDKADHVQMESHPDIPFDGFFNVPSEFGSDKMRRPMTLQERQQIESIVVVLLFQFRLKVRKRVKV